MHFRIDTTSREAIYQQIVGQVREGLARGTLAPGERLPSVRELARGLVVNPNTIARAYTELEREGTLITRPGLGVFVAEPNQELTKKSRQKRLVETMDRLLTEAVHLGFTSEEVLELVQVRSAEFQWPGADGGGRKPRS
ncbi:MAG: GntR family transcriptional regulator [Candidatus Omnitrophica bacterium]|nr:GntR family transcriptional regulator [Candidatus Omnitrophota bacterium]